MRKFISSDINIWFDFHSISKINLPFMLSYRYLMYREALREELLEPPALVEELVSLGLSTVEITAEEFLFADKLGPKYKVLSKYDRIALAIAKERDIPLLTGDKALRKAAKNEGVIVMGTIGILDELYENEHIDNKEYRYCLEKLLNNSSRRLPKKEIEDRIEALERE